MRKLALLIAGLFFSISLSAQVDTTNAFDLEQCLQYAFAHQYDIQSATLDIKKANFKKKEAIGMGLPQVHGKLQAMDNLEIKKQFLPANAFNPQAPEDLITAVGFGVQYANDMNITATQLLFSGAYLAGVKASKVYLDLFTKSLTRTKVEVAEKVGKAYYGVLVANQRVEMLKRDGQILDTLLRETKIRYENGFVEQIDVQRLQVQKNNVSVQLASLISFQEISKKVLKYQMGMVNSENLTLTGSLEKAFETTTTSALPTLEMKNRIEYQMLETTNKANKINVDYNISKGFPTLSLFGSAGYNTGANKGKELFKPDNYKGYSFVGLQLDVPIFQGFSKTHRVNQAKITLEKSKLDLAKLELGLNLEYEQTKALYNVNRQKIAFHKENIALADNVTKVTKIKYEQGMSSSFELTDAVSSQLDAKTNYYIALYEVIISHIDLQKSLGVLYQEGK